MNANLAAARSDARFKGEPFMLMEQTPKSAERKIHSWGVKGSAKAQSYQTWHGADTIKFFQLHEVWADVKIP